MQRPTIPIDDLIAYLFGAGHSSLADEVGPWVAASPRFRAFAETYRDKIRKKARGARDDEGRRDLTFELAVALRLLAERRFALEYESYGVAKRAPDFRVTFRDQLRFNVEVRRLRRPPPTPGAPADPAPLVRAVCDKLGQLPPSMINVLVLGADGPQSAADAVPPPSPWLKDPPATKHKLRYHAAWCSMDPRRVAEHYAPDGRLTINDGPPSVGRDAITETARSFYVALPDMQVYMNDLVVDGDRIEFHWTFTGTNTGPGGTGNAVRVRGYEEWTLSAKGLIATSLGHSDAADYARQLAHGV